MLIVTPKNCDVSVKKAIQLLSSKLDYNASPTFGSLTLSKTCTLAAGLSFLRVTGLQTDNIAMTGTLRGAYIDVSNGALAATGTIRGMELKARTEAPGDIGNDVAVLEGLSISADSKGHSVTTMRAAEFILDGKTGGTIGEAVGLRIANNLQANKATVSYGLQIYRDSFDYTADIDLTANPKFSANGSIIVHFDSTQESLFLGKGATYGDTNKYSIFIGHHAGYNNDTSGSIAGYGEALGNRNIYIGARVGAGETILTGTITGTNGSTAIVGDSTLFTSELVVGDIIRLYYNIATPGPDWAEYGIFEVTVIADNTHLTIDSNFLGDTTSGTYIVLETGSNKGAENIGIGHLALSVNSEGYENIAIGDNSLQWNTTGHNNTALGNDAIQGVFSSPITGNFNTAIGTDTLYVLSSGGYNTAVGYRALYSTTTESYCTAIGYQAGLSNTGSYITTLGYRAGESSSGLRQMALGFQAGQNNTGDYQSVVGYTAGYDNTGDSQAAFGYFAGYNNTGDGQVAIGYFAGYNNSGVGQTVFGRNAGYGNKGTNQSAYGRLAGASCVGNEQIAIGYAAGQNNTGNYQTAVGQYSGQYNDGANNTAFGYSAFNSFVEDGGSAVTFDFGDVDVANDRVTVTGHGLGANDTYLNLKFTEGTSSLPGLTDATIYQWKIIDANTLEVITITITAQGTGTGHTLTPKVVYTNSTALGYNAEPDASNQVVLGDTNVTLIKTTGTLQIDINSSRAILDLRSGNYDADLKFGYDGTDYGFYWRYKGSGSGNDNALELWAQNQAGADVQVHNITQDGKWQFTAGEFFFKNEAGANSVFRIVSGTDVGGAGFYLSNDSANPLLSANSSFGMLSSSNSGQLTIFVDDTVGNQFVFANLDNRNVDYAHAAQTNPTLFVHSDTNNTTQWVSIAHNQTNAVFGLGTGAYIFPDGSVGINTASPDTKLQVVGDCKFGDDNTNYLSVGTTGDTKFVGGAGLPFGSCYGNHIGWSQAAAAQNTWYNISDADMADGVLHNVTHDGDGKLTVINAGMYWVSYSICFEDNIANDHIEVGIEVSGSGSADDKGQCHLENKFANEQEHMGSSTILDLAASATLELAIRTIDAGTPTISVQAVNISAVQIGGT